MRLIVRTSDVISYHDTDANIIKCGEVGSHKYDTNDNVLFMVYPLIPNKKSDSRYVYAEDHMWVDMNNIVEHFSVRKAVDFYNAWISLGFQATVNDDDTITFELIFEEHNNDSLPENIQYKFRDKSSGWETEDDNESLRSVDTYSTDSESDLSSVGSFIVESVESVETSGHTPCDCDHCKATDGAVDWFNRRWHPPPNSTEMKVKSFIERLEERYC